MTAERYRSSSSFVWFTSIGMVVLTLLGVYERGFDEITVYGMLLFVVVILLVLHSHVSTYVEIRDKRILVNRGYKSFSQDQIDIYDIKYVYRVPQFHWRLFGGNLMVFYVIDENGKLKHSALREINYSDDTLKAFLKKITSLNPSITLDEQYKDLLAGKLGGENQPSFVRTPAQNTPGEVEKLLQEKGETWE